MKKYTKIAIIVLSAFSFALISNSCNKDSVNGTTLLSANVENHETKNSDIIATWNPTDGMTYVEDMESIIARGDMLLDSLFEETIIMEDYTILDSFPTQQDYTPIIKISVYNVSDSVGYNMYMSIDKGVSDNGKVVYCASYGNTVEGICENKGCRHTCKMKMDRDSQGRVIAIYCEECKDTWNVLKPASQKCVWSPSSRTVVINNSITFSSLMKKLI